MSIKHLLLFIVSLLFVGSRVDAVVHTLTHADVQGMDASKQNVQDRFGNWLARDDQGCYFYQNLRYDLYQGENNPTVIYSMHDTNQGIFVDQDGNKLFFQNGEFISAGFVPQVIRFVRDNKSIKIAGFAGLMATLTVLITYHGIKNYPPEKRNKYSLKKAALTGGVVGAVVGYCVF